ncbi:patatin-like phospholipase family protein [Hyphomicrobium sp. CS1GBMeth3]|uniref:patatin-like phospholipase family protein n=1 Tax=Hyphomicrobium sp. CS1GBMeth3 TaxID=1892845 RepID=UPI000930DED7|nr:patatin-like phospholipase family protein [Hyphomicrobium sp. CS1GBMeth3]
MEDCSPSDKRLVNLALQGGGSHGAFAWGVLDRLLEDERIMVEGIVGTSAGAMNAAVMASGLVRGGNREARAALRRFWEAVSMTGAFSLMQPSWLDRLAHPGSMDFSLAWNIMDALSRMLSPYQWNPTNYHPLRNILNELIDFEALRQSRSVKLFICATNLKTNRLRIFERNELSADAVLASACLPSVFQAVEIDGEHYWDGGFMGNPPIFPLIYNCESRDVVIVMINPITIDEVPRSAQAILDRINTLSFNSSLLREMRAIAFVTRLVDEGFDDDGRLKKMFIHCVDSEDEMRRLGVSSKLNVEWDFLSWLFELGRSRGDAFLRQHFDKLGRQSSVSIEERFL